MRDADLKALHAELKRVLHDSIQGHPLQARPASGNDSGPRRAGAREGPGLASRRDAPNPNQRRGPASPRDGRRDHRQGVGRCGKARVMTPKPGWTTSEWWLTVVFVAAMVVAGIGALGLAPDHWLVKIGAFVSAALAVAGYQASRARAKSPWRGGNR
jgi:hypothetical protein